MRSCAFGRAHSEPSMTVGVECYGIRNASSPQKMARFCFQILIWMAVHAEKRDTIKNAAIQF